MPGKKGLRKGQGQRKTFSLKTCLLVLLHREPGSVYSLMEGLKKYGFQPDQIDVGNIYRTLRELKAEGLVSEIDDENSLEPQWRVYTVTPHGKVTLSGFNFCARANDLR